mmetsp:Transcript_98483/g.153896  ORF Transcript_98483/g.153896 Transcript_98483/m.153896 type:complete len:1144 (-) Transcript_98483:100-3531(-)
MISNLLRSRQQDKNGNEVSNSAGARNEEKSDDEDHAQADLESVASSKVKETIGQVASTVDEEEAETSGTAGAEICVDSFDELRLDAVQAQAANAAWVLFINTAESREAAGEAIYAALFEGAPSLQSLFTTPRAVQALRFMNGLASFVTNLDNPPKLKILVETLGFGHLHLDVTIPRVVIFRDAILDMFTVELGDKFVTAARDAWRRMLNYVGGAIIFVKSHYADRVTLLLASWKVANDSGANDDKFKILDAGDMDAAKVEEVTEQQDKKSLWQRLTGRGGGGEGGEKSQDGDQTGKEAKGKTAMSASQVPKTYDDMFRFNAAVMGFGTNAWMNEVLGCFDNIVRNVSNSARLQEECDILVLRISKVVSGAVNFNEYKSCMLASLRSLLPKDWSTAHEVAWSWLWENVERLLTKTLGYPRKWEKALGKFIKAFDETALFELRKDIYSRFFSANAAGQDYFKQSNTYLHFIADRIIDMTQEIYANPVKMVDDVSALGLRHVGYGIPTELFGPFVTACVEAVQSVCNDEDTIESFRWSLALIGKMLVRTITEGSTIVMKAINSNSSKQIRKAITCAPRGDRANWMLIVQVGTQSISPLSWSIESGAVEAARQLITDLLTFRADRDRYYYGMDQLFKRHPDIVQRLCNEAPVLLPTLFDGLIWRSRLTENGFRRVNYYLRHLLIDSDDKFSPTLSWIAKTRDANLVCHPVVVLLTDTVWGKVACQTFLHRKSWFLFTLLVFLAAQSILRHVNPDDKQSFDRNLVFALRIFIYGVSMTQMVYTHAHKWHKAWKKSDFNWYFGKVPLPRYLDNWQEAIRFILMLILIGMLTIEPIIWCFGDKDGELFTEECKASENIEFTYSFFSMCAMFLYFVLLLDLAVLSTQVSAYVLVCIRMTSEVSLFLLALFGCTLAFSCSISVVKHTQSDFKGIHKGFLTLLEIAMSMYSGAHYETYEKDPTVLVCVFVFLFLVTIFLMNMLIAQLTCAYESVYNDMLGYARLERVEIIVVTMPMVSPRNWEKFKQNLALDEKTEFNVGDVGVTGGLQVLEPASANPTTKDAIKRFGGSTSVEMPWPADDEGEGDETEKFERMEKLIQKALKRLTKSGSGKGANSRSASGSGSGEDKQASHSSSKESDESGAGSNSGFDGDN